MEEDEVLVVDPIDDAVVDEPALEPPSGPPTLENCLVTLARADTLHVMHLLLPAFRIDHRWFILHQPEGGAERAIAKIRCIQGSSLQVSCLMHGKTAHGKTCRLHIDIKGRFEEAQCVCLRWAIFGITTGVEGHMDAAALCAREWRESFG